ncbi:MAG: hypothetical protein U5M50_06325 [Sphingobium sp.]|nr:hypothetical protein [Sphingobium sp.]
MSSTNRSDAQWEIELLRFMDASYPEIVSSIDKNNRILPEVETLLRQAPGFLYCKLGVD